jgi:hypothetical protein
MTESGHRDGSSVLFYCGGGNRTDEPSLCSVGGRSSQKRTDEPSLCLAPAPSGPNERSLA